MPASIVHLVSGNILPFPGGMEESILRIATGLADDGFEVAIYTLRQPGEYRRDEPDHPRICVEHLGDDKEFLLAPFRGAGASAVGEAARADHLFLQSAIERRIATQPSARHLILSFYVTSAGFPSQCVATSLGLPHIASVRGTDFELDIHEPARAHKIRLVAENAAQLLTTNRAQADMLSTMFRVRRPIRTIHNALAGARERPRWQPPESDRIRLVSDCGFSGRKATHLLLRAVETLIEAGLPVSLIVLGGIYHTEDRTYWERLQSDYRKRYPHSFCFPGRVAGEDVDRQLRMAHIYCSATLAEGCSMSRIRALTTGIPIVTTACGGILDVAAGCRHVRMCPPGDWRELARELTAAVNACRAGTLRPDNDFVDNWRRHFSPERERKEWRSAVTDILDEVSCS